MKEKFTITKEDEAYMDSIGKNLRRTFTNKATGTKSNFKKAKTEALKKRGGGDGAVGRSYYSGKKYKH